jgi:hypothetical protein
MSKRGDEILRDLIERLIEVQITKRLGDFVDIIRSFDKLKKAVKEIERARERQIF